MFTVAVTFTPRGALPEIGVTWIYPPTAPAGTSVETGPEFALYDTEPPPHAFTVGSMVQSLDFPELERVDGQAGKAMLRQPSAVMLIRHFRPVGDASDRTVVVFCPHLGGMSADIKDRWDRAHSLQRCAQISGNIKSGSRFKDNVLHLDFAGCERPCHRWPQVGALRKGPKPQTFQHLLAPNRQQTPGFLSGSHRCR